MVKFWILFLLILAIPTFAFARFDNDHQYSFRYTNTNSDNLTLSNLNNSGGFSFDDIEAHKDTLEIWYRPKFFGFDKVIFHQIGFHLSRVSGNKNGTNLTATYIGFGYELINFPFYIPSDRHVEIGLGFRAGMVIDGVATKGVIEGIHYRAGDLLLFSALTATFGFNFGESFKFNGTFERLAHYGESQATVMDADYIGVSIVIRFN